jgi:hypothetical protein
MLKSAPDPSLPSAQKGERVMLSYDEFTARVASRGGGGGGGVPLHHHHPPPHAARSAAASTSCIPPTPPPPPLPLLATLAETYDVYANLARSGLWFDINPSWHPTVGCYYLRCEPDKSPKSKHPKGGRGKPPPPRGNSGSNGGGVAEMEEEEEEEKREARSRTVAVLIAASRAALTTPRLATLTALGDEWAVELEDDKKVQHGRRRWRRRGRGRRRRAVARGRHPADGGRVAGDDRQ